MAGARDSHLTTRKQNKNAAEEGESGRQSLLLRYTLSAFANGTCVDVCAAFGASSPHFFHQLPTTLPKSAGWNEAYMPISGEVGANPMKHQLLLDQLPQMRFGVGLHLVDQQPANSLLCFAVDFWRVLD